MDIRSVLPQLWCYLKENSTFWSQVIGANALLLLLFQLLISISQRSNVQTIILTSRQPDMQQLIGVYVLSLLGIWTITLFARVAIIDSIGRLEQNTSVSIITILRYGLIKLPLVVGVDVIVLLPITAVYFLVIFLISDINSAIIYDLGFLLFCIISIGGFLLAILALFSSHAAILNSQVPFKAIRNGWHFLRQNLFPLIFIGILLLLIFSVLWMIHLIIITPIFYVMGLFLLDDFQMCLQISGGIDLIQRSCTIGMLESPIMLAISGFSMVISSIINSFIILILLTSTAILFVRLTK